MARVQFLMEDDMVQRLDALVERTGLKTRTQLINTALSLFEWAERERSSGRIIASIDEETERYKELEILGLPPVRRSRNLPRENVAEKGLEAEGTSRAMVFSMPGSPRRGSSAPDSRSSKSAPKKRFQGRKRDRESGQP